MVQGDADLFNSFFIMRFREDDNGDGTWQGGSEDMWSTPEITVDWDGWRLVSIPYSEMFTVTGGEGAAGNHVPNTDRILSVEYLLLADPTSGPTRGNLDYLIWTEGGPLKP